MELRRVYLEQLATSELAALAHGFGIEIPPALDRIFIIAELLEFAGEERPAGPPSSRQPYAPEWFDEPPSRRSRKAEKLSKEKIVPLPARYYVSAIHAIVRDPLWVFVFWELLDEEKQKLEAHPRFCGYFLKVTEQKAGKEYTIPVGSDDCSRYLHFAPGGGTFRVELGVSINGGETFLAATAAFSLPKILNTIYDEACTNELWLLSGIHDFNVLKNAEIPHRRRLFRCARGTV